jgi:hypothetical protein
MKNLHPSILDQAAFRAAPHAEMGLVVLRPLNASFAMPGNQGGVEISTVRVVKRRTRRRRCTLL